MRRPEPSERLLLWSRLVTALIGLGFVACFLEFVLTDVVLPGLGISGTFVPAAMALAMVAPAAIGSLRSDRLGFGVVRWGTGLIVGLLAVPLLPALLVIFRARELMPGVLTFSVRLIVCGVAGGLVGVATTALVVAGRRRSGLRRAVPGVD